MGFCKYSWLISYDPLKLFPIYSISYKGHHSNKDKIVRKAKRKSLLAICLRKLQLYYKFSSLFHT
jgi:hypothetical protein